MSARAVVSPRRASDGIDTIEAVPWVMGAPPRLNRLWGTIMRYLVVAALAVALAASAYSAVAAAPAGDDELCGTRADILKHLGGKYREQPVAAGIALNGGYVELLSAGSGATWTIVITKPDGSTCVVVAGEDWEDTPPMLGSKT